MGPHSAPASDLHSLTSSAFCLPFGQPGILPSTAFQAPSQQQQPQGAHHDTLSFSGHCSPATAGPGTASLVSSVTGQQQQLLLMGGANSVGSVAAVGQSPGSPLKETTSDMASVVRSMIRSDSGLEIHDRTWLKITIPNAFIGRPFSENQRI
ncbi:unnamed protein product [Protopolystoma xenopodis]|uniref:Uncharacterized protein n=1 Tax=Protopolystoma xenopodis TaxID=117903 RepID=A0A448X918_9PLAT|nr:unnamed protein product [Protopolystoma xenopodis]